MKESENNFHDTESTKNEDYDADEILKTTLPDPTEINKTIREIRKKKLWWRQKTWRLEIFVESRKRFL